MGNSCCSSPFTPAAIRQEASDHHKSHAIKHIAVVVAAEGRIAEVEVPHPQTRLAVAELLLEFSPGHFVTCLNRCSLESGAIHHTERMSPLPADADAVPSASHVYMLLPMSRLHTRLTHQERLALTQILAQHETTYGRYQLCDVRGAVEVVAASRRSTNISLGSRIWRLAQRQGARVTPLEAINLRDSYCVQERSEGESHAAEGGAVVREQAGSLLRSMSQLSQINQETMNDGQVRNFKSKPWAPSLAAIQEEREGR